ncbi:alpha-1,2-mannosyltransferase alg-11 [Plectosphaerella plurivora]|uniref:GDP-Man:Man(3)GlcNAc(2)-PP-Dol alpha-1,2-mannosyltransferase n=1 Tax=Plectosphaerella plurivora TaxID=936078 RepID=A0A9P8VNI0_9PEZI|nr:alpha-1,2-mannosyltransferase alg-11 [Plectosphaerella plurivora]
MSGLLYTLATFVAGVPIVLYIVLPILLRSIGNVAGTYLRKKTEGRRIQLLDLMVVDEKAFAKGKELSKEKQSDKSLDKDEGEFSPKDWSGIVAFFHPFCNAGGGGERVLWAAIRATQKRYPKALCIVYTGDHEVNKQQILARVKNRFNIDLHPPTVNFLYLSTRHLVLASTWPHFTLLGQSVGSMVMAWDAFQLLAPDIFIDTMGYAFALGLSKFLFPRVPTSAYVHYPTISTDMLESLDPKSAVGSLGVNAGKGTGTRGKVKRAYWQLFAKLYSRAGSSVDIVMTNSTWTQGHIQKLWGPHRKAKGRNALPTAVYPPCAVEELEEAVDVSAASESKREKVIIYIAQFRPEKNHTLVVQAFAEFLKSESEASKGARLVLLGSVRDDHDSKRVYQLRILVNELGVRDSVDFHLDASWPEILEWLQKASVGANGMWNEHFGIGVVEYQAAGLISVVHDSGGPKLDIVVEVDGKPTGFHATTVHDFAQGFEKAFSVPDPLAMRLRARQSAKRFTEGEFARKWVAQTDALVAMT